MTTTPEGKIKARVKALLNYQPECYYHMPVQNGMGRPTLDFIGCLCGRFFAIETKAPGKKPTPRQLLTIEDMVTAGAKVFVIDGDEGLEELQLWLHSD
jgi:hypothetical protein